MGLKKLLLLTQLVTFSAIAENLADLIQLEADTFNTNLESRKTEMTGHVHLRLGDRELFAEKLTVDPSTGEVECAGRIKFVQGPLVIEAKGVKINLKTGLGIFYNASVKRADAFMLEGKEIERVGDTVYKAKVAKISFCQDCPQSWSLVGDRVRVNTENYAELHHAVLQIRDVPLMYLPFIYYPAKDQRFSGFLIPYFKFSTALGAEIGVPFYYAPTNDLDFTWDYRYMSRGGHRNKLDSRFELSDQSYFRTSTAWIRTPADSQWTRDRYGIHYSGHMQFLTNWAFLARGDMVSDVEMSSNFEEDSTESRLPTLSNDLYVESQYENFSLSAGVGIPQNNLDRLLPARNEVRWTLPQVRAGVPLTPLFHDFLAGVRVEELSVRRFKGDSTSVTLGRDPDAGNFIASGDRYSALADITVPVNFDFIRSTSAVHYRGDYYSFGPGVDPGSASRSRFAFEQGFEGDFSRIWDMGWTDMPRMKHVLTPYVNYFYSPPDLRSNHEFFRDCPFGPCTTTAPRFDLFDGGTPSENVRLGSEEAERLLRPHSIATYGFKTQLLGKFAQNQEIREILFLNLSHEYDFGAQQMGKVRLSAQGHYSDVTLSSELAWDPVSRQTDLLNDFSIDKKYYALTFYQSIRPDADYIAGELRIKRLGPFEVATFENFDRRQGQLIEQRHYLSYSSFSKCWRMDIGLKRRLGDNDFEYSPSFQVTYSETIKDRDNLMKF